MVDDFISPKFKADKLSDPTFEDLVDVYEDRMRGWFFLPASVLSETRHCGPAAIGMLFLYFEGIEIYMSGEDSNGASKSFFFARLLPCFSSGSSRVVGRQNSDSSVQRG